MKLILPLFFLLSFLINTHAQPGTYQKAIVFSTANNYSTSSINTADGNRVVAGLGGGHSFVFKLTPQGDTIWTSSYQFIGSDYIRSVFEQADNSLIIVGTVFSISSSKLFLTKLSADGYIQWSKFYTSPDALDVASCVEDGNGGYLLAATRNSATGTVLIKVDATGTVQWTKNYSAAEVEFPTGLLKLPEGYIYCASTTGTRNHNYLVRLNELGDTLWTKRFVTDSATTIAALASTGNGYFLGGLTNLGSSNDLILVRTDTSGNIVLSKKYFSAFCQSIKATADGNFIMAGKKYGSPYSDALLMKFSPVGSVIWVKTYDSDYNDEAYSVNENQDGSFFMTGYFTNAANSKSAMMIQTDNLGNASCNESTITTNGISALFTLSSSGQSVTNYSVTASNAAAVKNVAGTLTDNCAVGLQDQTKENSVISFFPNPAVNEIFINSTKEILDCTIYTIHGKKVWTTTATSGKISIEHLPSGSYVLSLSTSVSTYHYKFLKN